MARELMETGEFFEVCRHAARDCRTARSKGLFKKARRGELKNFTGVDSPYEAPECPEIRIDTTASCLSSLLTSSLNAPARWYVEPTKVFVASGILRRR